MKLILVSVWVFCICLFLGRLALAEEKRVYQYTDDSGAMVFVEDPSEIPADKRPQAGVIKMKSETQTKAVEKKPQEKPKAKNDKVYSRNPEVILYMTAWCGYCRKMKSRLEELGVAYLEKDIEKDQEANRDFHRYGGSGVPLVVIDGTVIRGYNPGQVEATLEKYR